MKTVEELLKPRWKVIADYPGALHNIGDVISAYENGKAYLVEGGSHYMTEYPALFKRLEWWEDRAVKDMPEYVKIIEGIPFYNFKKGQIRKLDSIKNGIAVVSGCPLIKIGFIYPSSKQEYLTYINHPA